MPTTAIYTAPTGITNITVGYVRVADGLFYDFTDGAFRASPARPTRIMVESPSLPGTYLDTVDTPGAQWPDGLYTRLVNDPGGCSYPLTETFGVVGGMAGGTPPLVPGATDSAVLADVGARLDATGMFDGGIVGADPAQHQIAADRIRVYWVWRTAFQEANQSGPNSIDRVLDFAVAVEARDLEPARRFATLCQLEAAAHNAVGDQPLAGVCMAAWSRIGAGRRDPSALAPGERTILQGSCRYLVQGDGGHDASGA